MIKINPGSRLSRRSVGLGAAAVVGAAIGASLDHLLSVASSDKGPAFPEQVSVAIDEQVLNDASTLSPTPVARHIELKASAREQLLAALRTELKAAKSAGKPLIASAARHSMGAQSLARHGFVVSLDGNWLEADRVKKTYRVTAGTRWSYVITELDKIGFSPAVMQSNNDFAVGASFCVNAHGWPVAFGPCGSSVQALKLLNPDGDHITCSRHENADLFRHAMGGYGLFGIVTELELDMVPNLMLEPDFRRMSGPDLGVAFAESLSVDPNIQMAYGRMDVSPDRFLDEALLVTYRPGLEQSDLPPASGSGLMSEIQRRILRAQSVNDAAKHWRWWLESEVNPDYASPATRNSLMNESVMAIANDDPQRTDILHEYFIEPARFSAFVTVCKEVIPASYQRLLNITLRYVGSDHDSVLCYAPEPRIAAVMFFSQEKTMAAEADMARMTQTLIERVLNLGGSYYLPYRPHAQLSQFQRAYPRAEAFVAAKRRFDPQLLFANGLWENYLRLC